ncbi:patatin family protein [Anaerovorax odorimutans]|uniref:Patatin family protein n=1 Tax=Anaerovorax odorimutans TaxID=109327 RepID=A0ABT1RRB3_9FIRM|nr:patatin family protein [Anaerovorax odorimutans]MCQ4637739.1 patatin family protein [Anaerovorax odorimutans]
MEKTGICAQGTGLVLEGDALRGVFTAGVLDYFLKKGLSFPYAVGVSAGACNLLGYLSRQMGYIKNRMLPKKDSAASRQGIAPLIRTQKSFSPEQLFCEYPQDEGSFDYEAFFASETYSEFGATCCRSGRVEYFHEDRDRARLNTLVKASSGIPLFSQMVKLDGNRYLSGELSGIIPIERAIHQGFKRNVVILTRNREKGPLMTSMQRRIYEKNYKKHPRLLDAIISCPAAYREQIRLLERLEEEKQVFVIRPEAPEVRRFETDYDTLQSYYLHGYETAKNCWSRLQEFLKGRQV